MIKCIPEEEDLSRWIDLPTHSNIATAFDQFEHDGRRFELSESCNGGNMYDFISSLQLNLGLNVPAFYLEIIYDSMIQLTLGLEYAHHNGIVHGSLDLSNVVLSRDGENIMYKITGFRPVTALNTPLIAQDGTIWPFSKGRPPKKNLSNSEKKEILMLKDIYALGICLLELMIGRAGTSKFSISLDSLPLTWSEYPEATPLIQVLVECINID